MQFQGFDWLSRHGIRAIGCLLIYANHPDGNFRHKIIRNDLACLNRRWSNKNASL